MTRSSDLTSLTDLATTDDAGAPPAKLDLARTKALWLMGEWELLTKARPADFEFDPDRGRIAMLLAYAHQFVDDFDAARRFARLGVHWGCPPRIAAQILTAAAHNTLGRIGALRGDAEAVSRNFAASLAGASDGEQLIEHMRAVRELRRMGLLPEVAALIDGEFRAPLSDETPERAKARATILQSEIATLRHELSIAQTRGQLYRAPDAGRGDEGGDAARDGAAGVDGNQAMSQLGQDLWVLERTGFKRGGFFVEFGATDGILLSNTHLLEKGYAWRGLLAEPNPKYLDALRANRSATIVPACIAGRTGDTVEFVLAEEYGGIREHIKAKQHVERVAAYASFGENIIQLTTVSLHDFLVENCAPKKIDYISIDTEGNELDILETFPFEEWDVSLWTIEHNNTNIRDRIYKIMKSHGYERIGVKWDDWYFRADTA